MKPGDSEFDVCVVGGGPAGSSIARRLAQLGHRVCLVERERFPRPHIGESLPPTILPLLDELGVRESVERSGFLRPPPPRLRWATLTPDRIDSAGEAPGFQVDRGRFDQLLLEAARTAGVKVFSPARARPPVADPDGEWRLTVCLTNHHLEIRTRFLVDAAGKAGYLKRLRSATAPKTLAVYGYWCDVPFDGEETRIEDGPAEWYWGAPLPDGTWNATVFIDTERYLAAGRSGAPALYCSLLAASHLLAICLRGRLPGAPCVCDATCYATLDPVGTNWIKVGEASCSIDPLSSQGVQMAIGSGLTAAAVVNTLLVQPQNGTLAITFYRDAQRVTAENHRQHSAEIYRRQAAHYDSSFWQSRGRFVEPLSLGIPADRPPLKPQTVIQLAPDTLIIETGILLDGLIVPHPALMRRSWRRPVAFVGGLPIVRFADELQEPRRAEDVVSAWSLWQPADASWQVLAWLWKREALMAT